MDEASSTTGEDLVAISNEDVARLLGDVEPPVVGIEEFRGMIPSTYEELLVIHYNLFVRYKQLLGEQLTNSR